MIAVAVSGRERRWQVQQYGEWLVYAMPRRVTKKAKRSMVNDALLAGCRYYAPSGQGRFFRESPLQKLDDEEYRLLRLPDAAVAAAKRLALPPARCPAQVIAPTVNFCCEKTVIALSGCCRDVTLVSSDVLRAKRLAGLMLRQYGLPLRLDERPSLHAAGVICSLQRSDSLIGGRAGEGRIYIAPDLYEVDFMPPFSCEMSPTTMAGMLYAATRADWLRRLAVTRILPLDK